MSLFATPDQRLGAGASSNWGFFIVGISLILAGISSHASQPNSIYVDRAPSPSTWLYSYSFDDGNGVSKFFPFSLIRTTNGGYLVGGGGPVILNLDIQGKVKWQRVYDCSCSVNALVENSKGGYVAAGSADFLDESYIVVMRLDSVGGVIWSKRYRHNRFDSPSKIIQTRDGGYLLSGFSANLPSRRDGKAWLLKLGGSGAIQWQKSYNVAVPSSVVQLANGDLLVGTDQFSVLLLTPGGNVKWQRKYSGAPCCISGIMRPLPDDGFLLAGWRFDNTTDETAVIRANSDGSIVFSKTYAKQEFNDIQPTSDGGFVLLTTALSSRGTPIRISIMKLDAFGNVNWRKVSVAKQLDTPRSILQTADDGYIVTSSSGWIIKLDRTGSVGSICKNILTTAQTMVKDIHLTVEKRSPTVVVTHATPVVEHFVSAPVTPIVEPFCAP